MNMFLIALLLIGFASQTVVSFATPRSGFHSDIDGISIAPGSGHICVLEMKHGTDIGGRARCWGDEEEDGKTQPPPDVTFIQLASGISFTCGITLEQTVLCWGNVRNGGRVPGLFTQITASELYACGVRTDGSVLCWGHSHVLKDTPKPKDKDRDGFRGVGGVRKFVQVSCSTHHCCALDTNAHAHCWGYGLAFGEMLPPTKRNMTMIGADSGEDSAVTELLDLDEEEDEEEEEEEEVLRDKRGNIIKSPAQKLQDKEDAKERAKDKAREKKEEKTKKDEIKKDEKAKKDELKKEQEKEKVVEKKVPAVTKAVKKTGKK
mmetsp:Transcript_28695/g.27492  ORF Transcript_28695/g.27492 Transcript_28695/m.27492 type:complete len:319 (-) Transcript_28695:52-1008(-)